MWAVEEENLDGKVMDRAKIGLRLGTTSDNRVELIGKERGKGLDMAFGGAADRYPDYGIEAEVGRAARREVEMWTGRIPGR